MRDQERVCKTSHQQAHIWLLPLIYNKDFYNLVWRASQVFIVHNSQ